MKTEKYLGIAELQDQDGEYHIFELVKTATRIKFGSSTNSGFMEHGYMVIDKYFSVDENLQELLEDLQVGIDQGVQYTSGIVVRGQKTGKL